MPAKLYRWENWFGRPEFRVWAGKDYLCSQSSMCAQVRNEARKRNVFVTISDFGAGLTVAISSTRQTKRGKRRVG